MSYSIFYKRLKEYYTNFPIFQFSTLSRMYRGLKGKGHEEKFGQQNYFCKEIALLHVIQNT